MLATFPHASGRCRWEPMPGKRKQRLERRVRHNAFKNLVEGKNPEQKGIEIEPIGDAPGQRSPELSDRLVALSHHRVDDRGALAHQRVRPPVANSSAQKRQRIAPRGLCHLCKSNPAQCARAVASKRPLIEIGGCFAPPHTLEQVAQLVRVQPFEGVVAARCGERAQRIRRQSGRRKAPGDRRDRGHDGKQATQAKQRGSRKCGALSLLGPHGLRQAVFSRAGWVSSSGRRL